ncbi:hypothetical protein GCM10023116_03360 [Kistimonas scapharcae]|uniref:FBA domain-containing protein n=1 Tax=Kistimonas scapharcae TaxID=1036133 RepID=A0ABP8UWT4_9GAMM
MVDEPSRDSGQLQAATQPGSNSEMVDRQTNLKGDELQASIADPHSAPATAMEQPAAGPAAGSEPQPESLPDGPFPAADAVPASEKYKEDELLSAIPYAETEVAEWQEDPFPEKQDRHYDDVENRGDQKALLSEQRAGTDWYKKSETLMLPEHDEQTEIRDFKDDPVLRLTADHTVESRHTENREENKRVQALLDEIDAIGIKTHEYEQEEENPGDNFQSQSLFQEEDAPLSQSAVERALQTLSKSISLGEDGRYFFAPNDFGLGAESIGTEYTVRISQLPARGILVLDGEIVQADQAIPASSVGDLVFIPPANAHGDDYASIRYTISDGSQVSAPATLKIQVTAQSDDPEADARTLAMTESASHQFTVDDFGFSDADDGDTLQAITIKSLPATGTLTYDGVSVYVNQVIQASDIGKLLYTAPLVSSDRSASFEFTVSDGSASSEQQTFDIAVQNRQWMSDNLLTDPSGADWRMSHWDREGSWTTLPFGGHDSITGQWQGNGVASKSQTINLLNKGYSAEYLDTAPDITVQDWFVSTSSAYSARYQMQVELLDEYGSVIHSWQSSSVWATWSWNTVQHTLRDYGEGLRSIRFTHGGNGRGVVVDDTSVQIEDPTVTGTADDDILRGARNNDILVGDAGDDILYGGFGNDTMLGGAGADTFVFEQGDQTETSIPTVDTIRNFSLSEGDVLDLSDMLIGESAETIDAYLDLATVNGNTEISVKDRANGQTVQKIVLDGVDLSSLGSESEIINNLLNNGNLNIDH